MLVFVRRCQYYVRHCLLLETLLICRSWFCSSVEVFIIVTVVTDLFIFILTTVVVESEFFFTYGPVSVAQFKGVTSALGFVVLLLV